MTRARLAAGVCFTVACVLSFVAVEASGDDRAAPVRRGVPVLHTYDGDVLDTAGKLTPTAERPIEATPIAGSCHGFHSEMEPWLKAYGLC